MDRAALIEVLEKIKKEKDARGKGAIAILANRFPDKTVSEFLDLPVSDVVKALTIGDVVELLILAADA